MTTALKILLRVVRRRFRQGENLNSIFAEYPRLTEEEKAEICTKLTEI